MAPATVERYETCLKLTAEFIGITAYPLKATKDFDQMTHGHKSRNTYIVSETIGGFYLKPTDVKHSFYQAKDGTVVWRKA